MAWPRERGHVRCWTCKTCSRKRERGTHPGRVPAEETSRALSPLHVPGRELGPRAACGGQDGMAQGRRHWSLTTLREKLIKIGAKVARHAKYVTFQMAEVAVSRELSAAILVRIHRFGLPPPLVQRDGRGGRTKAGPGAPGWGPRLVPRGNGPESLSRKRQRSEWALGAGK